MKIKRIYRDNKLYLKRITLISTRWFTIKIHKVFMDDPENMHDHPWDYTSIILWGGYYEVTNNKLYKHVKDVNWYGLFSIISKKANEPHKLQLKNNKPAISLIFTSGKYRKWGFYENGKWIEAKHNKY